MSKKYRISEFARQIGRSASTVRRWASEGRIEVERAPSDQRCFTEENVRAFSSRHADLRRLEKTLQDELGGGR
ncbi:MerR family transcriptional regulator [Saccharopolyspora tripterygii]